MNLPTLHWDGYPTPTPPQELGGGSAQTQSQQRANGAWCAGHRLGGDPTFVPPNTPPGPATYQYYQDNNLACPVDPLDPDPTDPPGPTIPPVDP